jgi:hemerythrin
LDFFRGFKARLRTEGYRPGRVNELHESCTAWIKRHILRSDVQLKSCLSQTPVSDQPV